MVSHRCSRSELGSDSTMQKNPDSLAKKYRKYKDLCKELIFEMDELKQVMYMIFKQKISIRINKDLFHLKKVTFINLKYFNIILI